MDFQISIDDLIKRTTDNGSRDFLVVDVRTADDYRKDTYPGAVNIPLAEFRSRIGEVPSDKDIYLVCYTGARSDEICLYYDPKGYHMYSLKDGYHAYLEYKLTKMMDMEDARESAQEKCEKSIIKKFRKQIWSRFTKAVREYELIQDNDRIAVCISGGKDSMLMAKLFQELYKHGKQNFEVKYLVMDPGYNEINFTTVMNNAKLLGIPVEVFKSTIYDSVADVGENPCYLCARMRRGHLYAHARDLGCNKIALGHHFDDVIETILMGMLYGGQVQTMMPKLRSVNFPGMELIRPLYLIREDDIKRWRDYNDLYFIQCACRFTESCASCGGTGKGSKRAYVKALIKQLEADNPYVPANIFKSVQNVNLKTIIAYKENGVVHDFRDNY
ncbi:MAG: ATP-binding protein [Lachnospiraceae bacterium]|jgi:tRNA 2-thiocytidine biosynthesis protein TtcA|nr:ATP-binding protein [Lachnospiraceae bacterium]MEE3461296.1 ATP-binding protein [Lachnospiraceae bacterium]